MRNPVWIHPVLVLLMDILYETEELLIEWEFEMARLYTRGGRVLLTEYFYGDPTCGLISPDNSWAVIGGDHLVIWKRKRGWWGKDKIVVMDQDEIRWVRDIRLNDPMTVRFLTDPWSARAAVWQLDMHTLRYHKLRDFPDYRDGEYTETIRW